MVLKIGAGSAAIMDPMLAVFTKAVWKTWAHSSMGLTSAANSTWALETARVVASWTSGMGGAIGDTAMTLAPTRATPAVEYGRRAARINDSLHNVVMPDTRQSTGRHLHKYIFRKQLTPSK